MKGATRTTLDKSYILSRISEEEIFRKLVGDFKIGETFCNPLRGERTESTIIREIDGRLKMKDYGDSRYNGDCFDLVMFVNSCSYDEALRLIEKDFSLSSGNTLIHLPPKNNIETKPPVFKIITRAPTQEELRYWEDYHLGLDDLKAEEIYFPETIWRNNQKIGNALLTYCYWYEELQAWKLYRPHGEIGKRTWYTRRKWDSGIPNDYMENKSSFKGCDKAILATSKKDKMVLRKALELDCIGNIQAENLNAIKDEDMEYIKANSNTQYVAGDRDKAGKVFTWLLTNEFGFKHVNPPDDKPKDFADWGRDYGLEEIRNHFKIKAII